MKISHHLDDATLTAYASGTLDEALAVLVSCHLEVCSECREKYDQLVMVGGAMLDEIEPTPPIEAGSFGRLLEKISVATSHSHKPDTEVPGTESTAWSDLPQALSNYVDGDIDNIKWSWVGPGVWQNKIEMSPDANSQLRLLRIAKGRNVPEHGHNGQELTLILRGAYQDEIGHFKAGDVADLDEHIEHQPRVVSDEDCICLVALEAPTRFKGWVSRAMQPFVGI